MLFSNQSDSYFTTRTHLIIQENGELNDFQNYFNNDYYNCQPEYQEYNYPKQYDFQNYDSGILA